MDLDSLVPLVILVVCGVFVYKLLLKPKWERKNQRDRVLKQQQEAAIEELITAPNFKWSRRFLNRKVKIGIAVDKKRGKVCIFNFDVPKTKWRRILNASEILKVEVIQDGQTVMTTTPQNTIGNAIVGGILFGGAGAIVGASSSKSKTTTEEMMHSLSLDLLIDDIDTPRYRIEFLARPRKRDSKLYQEATESIRYYHSVLEILIQRAHGSTGTDSASHPAISAGNQAETPVNRISPEPVEAFQDSPAHPLSTSTRLRLEPHEHPRGEADQLAIAQIVLDTLQQLNEHLLVACGVINGSPNGATLRWQEATQLPGRENCIAVGYRDDNTILINGEIYATTQADIRRGVLYSYRKLMRVSSEASGAD